MLTLFHLATTNGKDKSGRRHTDMCMSEEDATMHKNSIIFVEEGGGGARLKTSCSNTVRGVCLFYQKSR